MISIFDAKSYQNRPEHYQRARSARKLCLGARFFRARRKINHRGLGHEILVKKGVKRGEKDIFWGFARKLIIGKYNEP